MTSRGPMRLGYVFMLAVGLCLAGAAQAKTIYVPANYKTIQAAINAAVKGDVVIVAKGRYKENIDFKGKAITVQSTKPTDKAVAGATIIDGSFVGVVVTFTSGETAQAALRGFTITNGVGIPDADYFYVGGGVHCLNGSSPTIANNIISGNRTKAYGGGVTCLNGSSPTLTGNTISGNSMLFTTQDGAGGVYCYASSPTMSNNTISGNSAAALSPTNSGYPGGGVGCYHNSAPTLTSNTISGNKATSGGGGVFCSSSSPTLTNNTISGNAVFKANGAGGGVCCSSSSSPTLTNNTISGNSADAGGGVACEYSSPTLINNTITKNSAEVAFGGSEFGGGGVYCVASSPTLTNNTISENSASHGGGVYCGMTSSPILKNTIVAFSTGGGGLYMGPDFDAPSKPVVTYCDVYGNTGGNYVNWPNQTGKNGNISKNPLFAWTARSNFYEQSKGGRWSPGAKSWIIDKAQSPCINAGDPKSAFANEPAPNGGRINMGAYGNTKYASKSAPKSASGGLLVSAAAAPVSGGGAQLSVSLSAAASVAVTITNLAGRPVAALPASDLPEGMSTLLWSGKGKTGLRVPAGTYLARVTARTDDGTQAQALSTLSLSR